MLFGVSGFSEAQIVKEFTVGERHGFNLVQFFILEGTG